MFVIVITILALIGLLVHLWRDKQPRTSTRVIELCLLWLFVATGAGGLFAFIGHAFFADQTARSIGWKTGSPFQLEVAFANLGFGVVCILGIWFRRWYWLAAALGVSIFLLGAAYGHIYEIVVHNNHSVNNSGPILYSDILYPLALLILLIPYLRHIHAQESQAAPAPSTRQGAQPLPQTTQRASRS